MTRTLGRWAEVVGYRADPPARLHEGTGGWLLVRASDPRALRLGVVAGQLVRQLTDHHSALTGSIEPAEEPKLAQVLEDLASHGFLRRILRPVAPALPRVSVVIPAYRRAQLVARCVASVRAQQYPEHLLEIIVVDDASNDDGETAAAASGARTRVVTLPRNCGPGVARQAGVLASDSELVGFLDTDCVAAPDWLLGLVLELADPVVAAAACRVRTVPNGHAVGVFESVRSPLDMGCVFGDLDPRGPRFFHPTADMIVRRSKLERCGGFATDLRVGEDVDLCLRLMADGGRIRYLPESRITHEPPRRLRDIADRRFVYGRSESFLWGRHPVTRSGVTMSIPRGLGAAALAVALHRRRPGLAVAAVAAIVAPAVPRVAKGGAAELRRIYDPGYAFGRLTSTVTNLSRYHATPLLLGEVAVGRAIPIVAPACIVGSALCEYFTLRPSVGAATYLPLHMLEDLAYSVGVTAGVLRPAFLRHSAVALLAGLERWPGRVAYLSRGTRMT